MIGLSMSLVLMLGSISFACSAEPASVPPPSVPPPSSLPWVEPDPEIPPTFTTYTDYTELFSISYPSDWDLALNYIPDFEKDTKEIANSLKTGLPIERHSTIFIAYGNNCISCVSTNIVVEPILEQTSEGVSTLDQMVEAIVMRMKIEPFQDYREFSRVRTTIDGREAAIVDCEAIAYEKKRHYIILITLAGKTAWRVVCSSTAEDYASWEKDFYAIVRSLRISD
jgi:hypothetical protein